MAQKVQTLFIDDLDGSEAEGTVQFGLDGTSYEIDLNSKHAEALRKSLASYVEASRKISASRRPSRTRRPSAPNGINSTAVREWARSQGIEVKERGRIPAELVVKFKTAAGA
jgi:Lsr2